MARTITFTDTYPYSAPTAARPRRRPEIPVRAFNAQDHNQYLDLNMLIDSGADTTCLPTDIAPALGIQLSSLPVRVTRGVNGTASTYRYESLHMMLANTAIRCPVLFVPNLPTFLLGREVVFDEFTFGFEQSAQSVHIRIASLR